jgi:hypothetical protein
VLSANALFSFAADADGSGGTLNVSDGVHTASVVLLGQFDPAGFHLSADNGTGTMVTYLHPDPGLLG